MARAAEALLAVVLCGVGACRSAAASDGPVGDDDAAISDAAASESEGEAGAEGGSSAASWLAARDEERRRRQRERMVSEQIESRGIEDSEVLRAMRTVPRHAFVPGPIREASYADTPLPIGHDQTISQPYIVALMTELAEVAPGDRVLEIGTGSGYQAAVLAEVGAEVWTIEILEPLAERARGTLESLGYGDRVRVRAGDGWYGWPEVAPFAAVVVTAAPPEIPQPLIDQIAPGGRLVAPVGEDRQTLVVLDKGPEGSVMRRTVIPVAFVPMTGEAQRRE